MKLISGPVHDYFVGSSGGVKIEVADHGDVRSITSWRLVFDELSRVTGEFGLNRFAAMSCSSNSRFFDLACRNCRGGIIIAVASRCDGSLVPAAISQAI